MDAGARCLTPQQIAQEQAAAQGQARTRADAQRQQAAQQQRQAQLQQTQQQSAKQLQQIGTSQNCAVCQIYAIAYPGQRCPYACPGSGSSQNGTIVPPVQNVLTTAQLEYLKRNALALRPDTRTIPAMSVSTPALIAGGDTFGPPRQVLSADSELQSAAEKMAREILDSYESVYLTTPAVTQIALASALKIPLRYLSKAESTALGKEIVSKLREEIKNEIITKNNAGSIGGGLIRDTLATAVEEGINKYLLQGTWHLQGIPLQLSRFGMEATVNSIFALPRAGDPRAAAAIGVVQASGGKVVEAAQQYALWKLDKAYMQRRKDELIDSVAQAQAAAERARSLGDHETYRRLMKSAIGLQGSIGVLDQAINEIP